MNIKDLKDTGDGSREADGAMHVGVIDGPSLMYDNALTAEDFSSQCHDAIAKMM